MTQLVATSEHNVSECWDEDLLSPELALVDPSLRAAAQKRIPDVTDRALRSLSTASPPLSNGHERFITLARAVEVADGSERSSRDRRSQSWRLVAGVASVTVLGLLFVDVHAPLDKTPASGKPSAIAMSTGDATRAQDAQPRRSPTPEVRNGSSVRTPPQSRRFAWAPVDNASGYHVEFFRGSSRVLARNTHQSQITIPAEWGFDGRRESLVPGEYRWYVWPIISGRRAARAIVQAELAVR